MATVNDIETIPHSGVTSVDALLDDGPSWNYLLPFRTSIYYTFDIYNDAEPDVVSLSTLNTLQRQSTQTALNYLSSITGIQFLPTINGSFADLHFAAQNIPDSATTGLTSWAQSWSYIDTTVTDLSIDAYVYLDNAEYAFINGNYLPGSAGYQTLLHELGHVMGLKHPFEDTPILPASQDTTDYTLMSYTDVGGIKDSYQEYDLAALQWIYGGDGLGGDYGINSLYGPVLELPPEPSDNFTPYNPGTMATSTLVDAFAAPDSGLTIDPATIQLVYGTDAGIPSVSLYDGGLTELGIGAGVLLTSGNGVPATSNTTDGYTAEFDTSNTDSDLQAVAQAAFSGAGTVQDVSYLQFSFTISDLYVQGISFDLVFGSDEYPEYSNSSYVDSAGVFLNGQNIALFNNQATQPLSVIDTNLSIGNFQNNSSYTSYGGTTLPAQVTLPIEYDGISSKLTINAALQPGVNTLKIAVGDTGDQALDSGLFIANLQGTQLGGSGLTSVTYGTDANDSLTGSDSNETFDTGAGNDIINPGLGDDIILAGLGNDTIYGGLGNNQIDGGDGDDLAIYTSSIKSTYIKIGANQTIKIGNASDTLLNVETIQFSDGSLSSPALLIEDDIAKVYLAYFGRAADPGGIDWWVSDINAGVTAGQTYNQALQSVVDNFARSAEAQSIYPILATGTLDSAGLNSFVTNVYQNLFDRAPDAAGLAYWVAEAGLYQTQGLSAGTIIKTIINGAQDLPGQLDRSIVQNKAQATWYYAEQYELQNKTWDNSHYTEAQNILDGITADLDSVNTVYAQIIGIVTA